MRILHVIEALYVGGAEMMLINLGKEQLQRGHQVAVMCLFSEGDLAEEVRRQGIEVYACHKNEGMNLALIKRMSSILRTFAADVIHCHTLMGNYYLAFIKSFAAPRAMQVVTRHGLLREGRVWRLNLMFHLSLWFTRWAVGVCDDVSHELHVKHPGVAKRIRTIKNGIDLSRFQVRNPQSRKALANELNLSEQQPLIGIVARLNPIKNHRLLLEAFAITLKTLPTAALVIIGDGPIRSDLESYATQLNISPSVFFLGDRSDVPALLAALDVFVLSSDNEGYSLALLEAAAAGLPLIATAVGGNADIVQTDKNGFIVPARDPAAMAAAFVKLITDKALAERLSQYSRTWVEQHGSLQAMADAYDQLYRS